MTQRERVLAELRRAAAGGITQVDFFAPHVIDGGTPITRLAARIQELRGQGYTITSSGTRHGCAVYRLVSDGAKAAPVGGTAGDAPAAVAAPSESTLFDPALVNQPLSPYDTLSDAA